MTRSFKTAVYREGSMCFIPVPFDPRPVFGKVRALSYTHQREHVEAIEGAKKRETRARRIAQAVKAATPSTSTRGSARRS